MPKSRPDSKPAVLDTSRKAITNLVHDQLQQGIKIPWYWREYGRYVVEKMYKQKKPVARRRAPTEMTAPKRKDIRKYEYYEDLTNCDEYGYELSE